MNYFTVLLFLTFSLFSQEFPEWIMKTEDSVYIYGVGSAPKSLNFRNQLRVAKMVARANLSENISVEVSSTFKKDISKNIKSLDYSTTQKSKNLLRYSLVKNRWTSKDGELFILMAIRKEVK